MDTHRAAGAIMGGPWQALHAPVEGLDPDLVANAALAALTEVDRQMSHFKPDSDLMRLNRAARGRWVEAPANLVAVMRAAAELAKFTDGSLNIGLGDAINAWGFGPDPKPEHRPADGAGFLPSSPRYECRDDPPAIRKDSDHVFNLSALAKGFAVDLASGAMRDVGAENHLVEAAGEVRARGARPDGSPWRVGLELPVPGRCLVYGEIDLVDMSIATSGGYRKYHSIDDKIAIHTLDPKTGLPLEGDLLSVSVLDPCCMRADALATALFVMGAAKGSAFADCHELPALFLIRVEEGVCEIRSRGWMRYLSVTGQDL